ncbi:MAG: HAD hydrolase-like protein [Ignavibacteria bacterium]|nr:HAD hydrolase-like protein [Ignavibacteria bacterium]
MNIDENYIVSSTIVLQKYLFNTFLRSKFFAIVEDNFVKEIEESGLVYSKIPEEIDILIVTLDRTLNNNKLEIAARALENGARFFAANIDDTCPVDEGEILDAGSTISTLEKRTHKKLELNFGKPSVFMFEEIKRRLKVDLKRVLLIGDSLETDIALETNLGLIQLWFRPVLSIFLMVLIR